MKMTGLVGACGVVMAGLVVGGAWGDEPSVEVIALEVERFPQDMPEDLRMHGTGGTSVRLAVRSDDPIVQVDMQGSAVEVFEDSAGTDLLASEEQEQMWMSPTGLSTARVSEQGTMAVVEISGEQTPDAEADSVAARGTLMLQVASEVRTERFEDVALGDDTLTLEDEQVKVGDEQDLGWGDMGGFGNEEQTVVVLTLPPELSERIADVRFVDEAGEAIAVRGRGSFAGLEQATREYTLDGEVERASVEVDVYEQLDQREVAVDVQAGLSLE